MGFWGFGVVPAMSWNINFFIFWVSSFDRFFRIIEKRQKKKQIGGIVNFWSSFGWTQKKLIFQSIIYQNFGIFQVLTWSRYFCQLWLCSCCSALKSSTWKCTPFFPEVPLTPGISTFINCTLVPNFTRHGKSSGKK